jgi:hypothetical protein
MSSSTRLVTGTDFVFVPIRNLPAADEFYGDVGFLTVEKGSGYGIEEDYSEVCWFYDLDATPSMPEGPIAVNVFARLYDADTFFAVCRRMRLEGAKRLEIARA